MESKARSIFRYILAGHYVDEPVPYGEEIAKWLKAHGGYLDDPQLTYDYPGPVDEGDDVTSKNPELALAEAEKIMKGMLEWVREGLDHSETIQWLNNRGDRPRNASKSRSRSPTPRRT
jgi:hypothetical protein